MKAKSVGDSRVEMRMIVMPQHTNPLHTIFGGVVMGQIDMAASMVAERHSGRPAVTVHISDISFKAPMRVGDHCRILASLNFVGNTSMLIGVKVYAENPKTSQVFHTTTAYLVFVALDNDGLPSKVPPLDARSQEEKRRYREGGTIIAALKKRKK